MLPDESVQTQQKEEEKFLSNQDGSTFEGLRSALWNALGDFLPHLAGGLKRIARNDQIQREEIASQETEIETFNRANIREGIQSLVRSEMKRAKTASGEMSLE